MADRIMSPTEPSYPYVSRAKQGNKTWEAHQKCAYKHNEPEGGVPAGGLVGIVVLIFGAPRTRADDDAGDEVTDKEGNWIA